LYVRFFILRTFPGEYREDDFAATILDAAKDSDLIVMATESRHGIVDAMRRQCYGAGRAGRALSGVGCACPVSKPGVNSRPARHYYQG
jgi:hypothetical protein